MKDEEEMSESGYPVSIEDRIFDDNLPSKSWVQRFIERHPNLTPRTAEHLGHMRKAVTKENLEDWFKVFEQFLLSEHGIQAKEFLTTENSNRVFNLDESGFPLGATGKLRVMAEKGSKNVYNTATENKEQITVLGCVSADGTFEKPFVLFPGVRPTYNLRGIDPSKYNLGVTKSGWISSESFCRLVHEFIFQVCQG